jgi:hypothetical protein
MPKPNPPSKKKKSPPPSQSGLPRVLDRGKLIEIVQKMAESPGAISDDCLEALADVAFQPREAVKAYFDRCWKRAGNVSGHLPPSPLPDFSNIEPEF